MNANQTAKCDHRESSDDYHDIVVQDGKWRVIVCKDGIQWILQRRRKSGKAASGVRWDGVSYCTTNEAINRLWRQQTGKRSSELEALPEHIRRGRK